MDVVLGVIVLGDHGATARWSRAADCFVLEGLSHLLGETSALQGWQADEST